MTHVTLAELITMCSLATSPNPDHVHDTLHRVVLAHSKGNSLTILDATTSTTYAPGDVRKAAAIVAGLEASAHRVHVGLAGLSSTLRRRLGVDVEHALDPCTNIGFASLELERVLGKKKPADVDALHRGLAAYFHPKQPTHLQAIDWGSRVLLVPHVSVRAQVSAPASARAPTVTFSLGRSSIFPDGGTPKTPPKKSPPTPSPPVEAKAAPKTGDDVVEAKKQHGEQEDP